MVARLPTEQEVVGSSPTSGFFGGEVAKWSNASRSGRDPSGSGVRTPPSSFCLDLRYGVVGNMSGSHPVASGSIPGIGYFLLSLREVGGSIPPSSNPLLMGALAQMVERPLSMFIFWGVIAQR